MQFIIHNGQFVVDSKHFLSKISTTSPLTGCEKIFPVPDRDQIWRFWHNILCHLLPVLIVVQFVGDSKHFFQKYQQFLTWPEKSFRFRINLSGHGSRLDPTFLTHYFVLPTVNAIFYYCGPTRCRLETISFKNINKKALKYLLQSVFGHNCSLLILLHF